MAQGQLDRITLHSFLPFFPSFRLFIFSPFLVPFLFFIFFFGFWCYVDLSSLLKLMHDQPLTGTKSLFMTVQSSMYTYSVTPTGRLATFKRQVFIYVKMTDRSYYFE